MNFSPIFPQQEGKYTYKRKNWTIEWIYGIFKISPGSTQAKLPQETKKVWTLQPKPRHTRGAAWEAAWGAAQARCSSAALPSDYIIRPVALVQHCSSRGAAQRSSGQQQQQGDWGASLWYVHCITQWHWIWQLSDQVMVNCQNWRSPQSQSFTSLTWKESSSSKVSWDFIMSHLVGINKGPVMDWTNDSGLDERYRKWKKWVEILFKGPLNVVLEGIKCNYVIYWSGDNGMDLVDKWTTEGKNHDENKDTLNTYWTHFEEYIHPQTNKLIAVVELKWLFQGTLSLEDFHTKALRLVTQGGYGGEAKNKCSEIILLVDSPVTRSGPRLWKRVMKWH